VIKGVGGQTRQVLSAGDEIPGTWHMENCKTHALSPSDPTWSRPSSQPWTADALVAANLSP